MVEGDEDEESYASEFADLVLNDDVDDSGTRLEPSSHKENPKKVDDDDVEIEKEKKDDIEINYEKEEDADIEKEKKDEEIEKEKNNDNVEETDKVVKEKDIVDDVMVYEELTATTSPTTATTSKIRKVLNHCNKVVPDTTFAKTKEMIIQEMPRLVNIAVNKDREVDPIKAKEIVR
ncbi:hypothetical protein Tco_1520875 [Tanacetum coccineum]